MSLRAKKAKFQRYTFGEVSKQINLTSLDDYYGQLGIGEDKVSHSVPKVCSFNIMIHHVACGEDHTVFVSSLHEGGYVYSMGSNADYKLGIGN